MALASQSTNLLPMTLPRIPMEEGVLGCCTTKGYQPDAYLDHSKEAHPLSLKRLAFAIQQGVDVQCIERYLKAYNAEKLAAELRLRVLDDQVGNSFPILYFAAEQNSPELLRVFRKAGADLTRVTRPSMLPILAYTILNAERDASDTTDSVIALLALGAKPDSIPRDMWQEPLKAPTRDTPQSTMNDSQYNWCTSEIREAFCRNLTLMQRYALKKAEHMTPPTPRMLQVAEAYDLLPSFETPYHIIGQQLATSQIQESIISHFLFSTTTPLVILLTGPSGHGKTELAKQMGDLLSLPLHRVDCAEMKHETDLFGPKPPYQNHQVGSPLNNHLAEHTGTHTIIFLDEFDKTTPDVHKSLLLLFESGFYKDRRNAKKLDCTKTLWLLAANLGESLINKFGKAHVLDHNTLAPNDITALQTKLHNQILQTLGAPLTGRLSAIIPYLPFTPLEQAVATYKFMRELRAKVRKPIDIATRQFGRHMMLDFIDDAQIALRLARQGYVPELGARSLKNVVDREIGQRLAKEFLGAGEVLTDGMNEGPLERFEVRVKAGEGVGVEVRRAGVKVVEGCNVVSCTGAFATAGMAAALQATPSSSSSEY